MGSSYSGLDKRPKLGYRVQKEKSKFMEDGTLLHLRGNELKMASKESLGTEIQGGKTCEQYNEEGEEASEAL